MATPTTENQKKAQDYVTRGSQALQERRLDDARLAFELAIDADADCVEAYLALSRLRFPGENYLDLLSRIHQALKPRSYVEVGVGRGLSLQRTLPATACVGIDPAPAPPPGLPAHVRVFPLTSNAFFSRPNVQETLGFREIDLAFIDGMHLFEYALDDFQNLERYMSRSGTILVHDCIPFDHATSARERTTRFWTGDVWRILPTLRQFRPDLSITVVGCAPSGLAIIQNLDPTSQVIAANGTKMLAFGQSQDMRAVTSATRYIPNAWAEIAKLFKPRVA